MKEVQSKAKFGARVQHYLNPAGTRKASDVANMRGAVVFSMAMLILTKFLGFVRDILINQNIGYGLMSDGFYLGLSIPDLFYEILIGGALSAAVTPTLSSAIEHDEEKKAWGPINTFFTLVAILTGVLIVVGELYTGQIIRFLNPGKPDEMIDIATSVAHIVFFQTIFFILLSEAGAVLNANKVFGLPNVGNTLYTLVGVFVLAFFVTGDKRGTQIAAVGLVVGSIVYFLFLLYFAKPHLKYLRVSFHFRDKAFYRLLWLAAPALLARTMLQVNRVIQQAFTHQFGGAVTSLTNSVTFYNLPYGIITVGIGMIVLPNLSGFFARGALREARQFLNETLRFALFLVVPFAVLFTVCSFESVQFVYQWNVAKVSNANVAHTASMVRISCFVIPIISTSYFIDQTFFAMKKSWVALCSSTITLILNPIFCYLFVNVLGMGLRGVALATVAYFTCDMLMLCILLRHFRPEVIPAGIGRFLLQILVCAGAAVLVLLLLQRVLPVPIGKLPQIGLYILRAAACFGSFIGMGLLIKLPEGTQLMRKVRAYFPSKKN